MDRIGVVIVCIFFRGSKIKLKDLIKCQHLIHTFRISGLIIPLIN